MEDNIPYNNRELSWLDFNSRVLDEASRDDNPILDRVKFLAITASNLDEFFMVRVSGLMEQVKSKYIKKDHSGMTPLEQLEAVTDRIHKFIDEQYKCLSKQLIPELNKNGISFLKISELSEKQKKKVDNYFDKVIFPILTPLAVDQSRPFPALSNKSLNIAVRLLEIDSDESHFALVQVPSILPRFFELTDDNKTYLVALEDIIIDRLSVLFELHPIKASCLFRITRDGDLDIDEEAEDLLVEIQESIKKRKKSSPVRLEISKECDKHTKKFLTNMIGVEEREVYEINGFIDLTCLFKVASLNGYDNLRFHIYKPVDPPSDFCGCADIFRAIREKDKLVHHPYESFDSVIRFAEKAASDPNVLAIKQTLYRVSGNSPIIAALIKAAENGKQVTVLVELKARFDEENNIIWAKKLENAGCHVIYGIFGLKTHCKILLVVRKEDNKIRRYLHLGTGNYNDSTANIYTDLGLFTCTESLGRDGSLLFNSLTGYSRPPQYEKFVVAPLGMRNFFEEKIEKEIDFARHGKPSGITMKMNSLVDYKLIKLLYKASSAGVKINLIVRGICCLVPGVAGISENINVISIVGRYLEHSRLFKFENGGDPLLYMGSADLMPRNLDKRVELLFPIEDNDLKLRCMEIFDLILSDNTNARKKQPDNSYAYVQQNGEEKINSQKEFMKLSRKAQSDKLSISNLEQFNKN